MVRGNFRNPFAPNTTKSVRSSEMSLTLEKNPLNDLHRSIIMERQKRSKIEAPIPQLDKLEMIETAKIFKDTIFLERQLEAAKAYLFQHTENYPHSFYK